MSKFLTSGLILFLVVDSFAQPVTPTTILQQMPEPPKSVEEALKRCPQESDTVAARALGSVELLDRDSHETSKQQGQALTTQAHRIQIEIGQQKKTLRTSLDSLTSPAAQQLLDEVK